MIIERQALDRRWTEKLRKLAKTAYDFEDITPKLNRTPDAYEKNVSDLA